MTHTVLPAPGRLAAGDTPLYDCRTAFAETLVALAELDPRIVAVVNDSVGSSKLGEFAARFGDRLINVGIAEQDMVGVAAGLANGGKIPFVASASSFLIARAMEQIKIDAAYSRRNVTLCGMSPGMAYGELGPTHHSIEDLAWLRVIPELTVIAPSDPLETAGAVRWAARHDGPVFLRISRMPVPLVNRPGYRFEPGRAVVLRPGSDVALLATGTVVGRALDAAGVLAAQGIDARVISVATIKPLDQEAVIAAARETAGIVTVEEALTSGLGGAVAELLARSQPAPMRFVGVQDSFAPTGSASWLLDHFGISVPGIVQAARELVSPDTP